MGGRALAPPVGGPSSIGCAPRQEPNSVSGRNLDPSATEAHIVPSA